MMCFSVMTQAYSEKEIPSSPNRSRTYHLPITSSDALQLSYRRLVGAKAIKLGSWNKHTSCSSSVLKTIAQIFLHTLIIQYASAYAMPAFKYLSRQTNQLTKSAVNVSQQGLLWCLEGTQASTKNKMLNPT